MSLPKTQRGRSSREHIIEQAAALVAANGVGATSLDAIVQAADVSKSQFYHYFQDKADLLRAVIPWQAAQVLAAQQPLLAQLASWEDFDTWADQLIRLQEQQGCRGGCPLGTLANVLADTDEATRATLVTAFAEWEAFFATGLTRLQHNGALRQDADIPALAVVLLAAVQGGLLLTKSWKDVAPLRHTLMGALAYLHTFAP
jgi:TetR/AcrR family transcriptional repressor of nem operon